MENRVLTFKLGEGRIVSLFHGQKITVIWNSTENFTIGKQITFCSLGMLNVIDIVSWVRSIESGLKPVNKTHPEIKLLCFNNIMHRQ